jgi:hypothetical protein
MVFSARSKHWPRVILEEGNVSAGWFWEYGQRLGLAGAVALDVDPSIMEAIIL